MAEHQACRTEIWHGTWMATGSARVLCSLNPSYDLARAAYSLLLQSHRSGAVSVYKMERTPALYQTFVICDH